MTTRMRGSPSCTRRGKLRGEGASLRSSRRVADVPAVLLGDTAYDVEPKPVPAPGMASSETLERAPAPLLAERRIRRPPRRLQLGRHCAGHRTSTWPPSVSLRSHWRPNWRSRGGSRADRRTCAGSRSRSCVSATPFSFAPPAAARPATRRRDLGNRRVRERWTPRRPHSARPAAASRRCVVRRRSPQSSCARMSRYRCGSSP